VALSLVVLFVRSPARVQEIATADVELEAVAA